MMRLRRASAIVALLLLTSAATAYAECAWVMWGDAVAASKDKYSIVAAYGTEAECKSTLPRVAAEMAETLGDKAIATPLGYQILGHGRLTALSCLPDTVDPRGPKGK